MPRIRSNCWRTKRRGPGATPIAAVLFHRPRGLFVVQIPQPGSTGPECSSRRTLSNPPYLCPIDDIPTRRWSVFANMGLAVLIATRDNFRPNYQVDGYEYRHIGPRRNATLSSTLKCSGVSVNTDMQRKNSMPGNLLIQLRRFDNQHVAVPSNEDPHGIDWRIR